MPARVGLFAAAGLASVALSACASTQDESAAIAAQTKREAARQAHPKKKAHHRADTRHSRKEAKK